MSISALCIIELQFPLAGGLPRATLDQSLSAPVNITAGYHWLVIYPVEGWVPAKPAGGNLGFRASSWARPVKQMGTWRHHHPQRLVGWWWRHA